MISKQSQNIFTLISNPQGVHRETIQPKSHAYPYSCLGGKESNIYNALKPFYWQPNCQFEHTEEVAKKQSQNKDRLETKF